MTILEYLRHSEERFVLAEDISRGSGVSRTAVLREIENLKKLGYEIESRPHLGYRYLGAPDKMFADEISSGLDTTIVGHRVFSYDELDSTNDAVFKLAEKGAKEGVVIFAEYQKKGRGRFGRSWIAPKSKNILLSVLLRPSKIGIDQAPRITLTAAVSVIRALRRNTKKRLGIKWPNDIVFENRKLCGILTELKVERGAVRFVVVGIGLNVNAVFDELPERSVSLKEITGENFFRPKLAGEILKEIDRDYLRLREGKFAELAREWEEYSSTSGKRVSVKLPGRSIEGEALGIDVDGALLVRKDNGLQERILAGEVEHLR